MASVARNLDNICLPPSIPSPKEDQQVCQRSRAPWSHFWCYSNCTWSLWGDTSPRICFPSRNRSTQETRARFGHRENSPWDAYPRERNLEVQSQCRVWQRELTSINAELRKSHQDGVNPGEQGQVEPKCLCCLSSQLDSRNGKQIQHVPLAS